MTEQITNESLSPEQIEEALYELRVAEDVLPVDAIRLIQKHRDEFVPHLIESIERATEHARATNEQDLEAEQHHCLGTHFFAIFLLSEFEAREALPTIVRAVSLPGEKPFLLFGDVITTTLSRTLALLDDEALSTIDAIALDDSLNEYVRGAATSAILHLVANARLGRDVAIARLQSYLQTTFDRDDADGVLGPAMSLLDLHATEAVPLVRQVFERDLIDEVDCSIDDFEEILNTPVPSRVPANEYYHALEIDDSVEELKYWSCFDPEVSDWDDEEGEFDYSMEDHVAATAGDSYGNASLSDPDTIVNETVRVGRNDPCPCGSGKKYKKCCLSR